MKLCKDCKWCAYDGWGFSYEAQCFVKHGNSKSLIDGTNTGPVSWCHLARDKDGSCGPEAKLFEPKKKWWRFSR